MEKQRVRRAFFAAARRLVDAAGIGRFVRSAAVAATGVDPTVAATFLPFRAGESYALLRRDAGIDRGSDLPVPPEDLWLGYGTTVDGYLKSGKDDLEKLLAVAGPMDQLLRPDARILDFGCASGRMLRWLVDYTARGEVWGVDISGAHITWCQQNLSPPFRFFCSTTFPHLPFEENYFDLIYAASVFTHISDLAETWLMELRRITRPGGRMILTIHDKHSLKLILDSEWARSHPDANSPGFVEHGFRDFLSTRKNMRLLGDDFAMATVGRSFHSQVFHDGEHIRRHWGRYLKVHSITPEAHGYQSAVLLEKA